MFLRNINIDIDNKIFKISIGAFEDIDIMPIFGGEVSKLKIDYKPFIVLIWA